MHLFKILLALMALFVMVLAVPIDVDETATPDYVSPLPDDEPMAHDDFEKPATASLNSHGCPNGWRFCGICNGDKCKIAGLNYICRKGTSCTKQSGGGDGALCGSGGLLFLKECPGRNGH